MLRTLLADRFNSPSPRAKEFSIYELQVAKGGPKLKPALPRPTSSRSSSAPSTPEHRLPARNVSMSDLAILMQRAMLDRPVIDKTGLSGKLRFRSRVGSR